MPKPDWRPPRQWKHAAKTSEGITALFARERHNRRSARLRAFAIVAEVALRLTDDERTALLRALTELLAPEPLVEPQPLEGTDPNSPVGGTTTVRQ